MGRACRDAGRRRIITRQKEIQLFGIFPCQNMRKGVTCLQSILCDGVGPTPPPTHPRRAPPPLPSTPMPRSALRREEGAARGGLRGQPSANNQMPLSIFNDGLQVIRVQNDPLNVQPALTTLRLCGGVPARRCAVCGLMRHRCTCCCCRRCRRGR